MGQQPNMNSGSIGALHGFYALALLKK